VRKPHRVACALAVALVVVGIVGVIGGCGQPQAKKAFADPFFDEDESNALVSGDMDKDETQWRKELHHQSGHATQNDPPQSDPLLKDDPPKAPEHYGKVTNDDTLPKDQVADAKSSGDPYATVDDDPAADDKDKQPTTFWQSVGRASFAAFTVLITLGMMAAPYLMMM
jgi:hypothetical protein